MIGVVSMFCASCGVHFSSPAGDARCPHCGSPGAPTAARGDVPAAPAVGRPAPPAPQPAADPDRTKTEMSGAEPWSPGALVAGKYEVLARLGAGGFGTVYKVRHIFRKKYYALKTPHPEFARDEMFRRRFEREIEAMERFVHPDAVMIRDSGVTEGGLPYYTMDFIEGESLRAALQRERRFPVDRAIRVVTRILNVLEVAHASNIIHRDLKPDNVLLARTGGRETVKVLDFGVAKLLDLVGETGSITHGQRVGTPKYMSPEQITGDPVDARSDLFALGIVLYEMVTGQHPFAQVRDPIRITAAILNREPTPPKDLVEGLPRGLNDAILAFLDKRVRRRPQNASAALRLLESLALAPVSEPEKTAMRVSREVPRGRAVPLVLRQETSAGERRCFLLFDERVTFGRSGDPSGRRGGHLILRALPCRSQVQDAEHWNRNLTISQVLGSIFPDGTAVVIEPASAQSQGLAIGGVRSQRAARLQVDRFALSLGDRALELDGYRHLRSVDEPKLDLTVLEGGRPLGLEPPTLAGFSNAGCLIDAVCLFRTNNWPLHEYYLVYRMLRMGSSPLSPLRLRGAGIEEIHVGVVFEGGESFLVAIEGEARVVCRTDDAPAEPGRSTSFEIAPGDVTPIRPGMEIQVGENRLVVDAATDADYKTT